MSSATPRICNKTLNSIQISLVCKRCKHSKRHVHAAGSTSDSLQGGSTSDSLQGGSLGPIFLYFPQDVVVSCNLIVISNSMYMSYLWLGLFRFLFWRGRVRFLPTLKRCWRWRNSFGHWSKLAIPWSHVFQTRAVDWSRCVFFPLTKGFVKHANAFLLAPFWVIETVSDWPSESPFQEGYLESCIHTLKYRRVSTFI